MRPVPGATSFAAALRRSGAGASVRALLAHVTEPGGKAWRDAKVLFKSVGPNRR